MKFKKTFIGVVLTTLVAALSATIVISCIDVTNTKDKKVDVDSKMNKFVYDSSNNYYESLNGLSGLELMKALRRLQETNSRKQMHRYGDLPSLYSKVFRDMYYDKDNSLVDIYSEVNGKDPYLYPDYTNRRSSANAEGQGTNREHIVPQSWFRENPIPRADAHFVVPSDIFVNSKRGNLYHDNVVNSIVFTSKAGGKLGKNSLNIDVFEPHDMVKGDIARAYLYYALTYASLIDSTIGNSFFKKNDPNIPTHYLDVYKKWHDFDTVDEFNIHVNNGIAEFSSGLRNPFVDYPDLFENLFGENPKKFVNKGILTSIKKS